MAAQSVADSSPKNESVVLAGPPQGRPVATATDMTNCGSASRTGPRRRRQQRASLCKLDIYFEGGILLAGEELLLAPMLANLN